MKHCKYFAFSARREVKARYAVGKEKGVLRGERQGKGRFGGFRSGEISNFYGPTPENTLLGVGGGVSKRARIKFLL